MTRRKAQTGSAVLEFALGSSICIALFTGTFSFGYAFYGYNKLETAVRNGARYGALLVYSSNAPTVDSAPSSAFATAVQNVTVYGNPSPGEGAAAVVPGLTPANVA